MIIENDLISADIDLHGAELTSLKRKDSDEELIWTAQKDYWGRHAPMLFPIVGKVWKGEYRVGDKTYSLPQHGFARDRDFKVLCHDKESLVLCLESDEQSLKVFPYKFRLEATYRLEDNTLIIEWRIKNPGSRFGRRGFARAVAGAGGEDGTCSHTKTEGLRLKSRSGPVAEWKTSAAGPFHAYERKIDG